MRRQVTVNGVEYPSISEACRSHDISIYVVLNRIHHLKWDIETAILSPQRSHKHPILFEGTLYKSLISLAEHYSVDYNLLISRLSNDWSLEEAITAPVRGKSEGPRGKGTYVRGVYYESIRKAAKSHNLKPSTVYARLHSGWSTEDAILTPLTPLHKHTRIILSEELESC